MSGCGTAVNHHGEFGQWALVVCKEPRRLSDVFEARSRSGGAKG